MDYWQRLCDNDSNYKRIKFFKAGQELDKIKEESRKRENQKPQIFNSARIVQSNIESKSLIDERHKN